jgi:NAD(P)-dependent dehydrogenase (short-subunit alcohol dehydrogenase family)
LPDNSIPGQFTESSLLDTDLSLFRTALETNTLAVIQLCQHLIPLMKANHYGRIVNVTSQVSQLSSMQAGLPAYRVSKVALNAITAILADELRGSGILCNCVSPGWVKTDMGGPNATLTTEEGTRDIVMLATLPNDGPRGQFFRNGVTISW